MDFPKTPRYKYVYDKVIEFFFEFHLVEYPINPLHVIERICKDSGAIIAATYDEFVRIFKSSDKTPDYIRHKIKTEDGFIMLRDGVHYIIYNDKAIPSRLAFTLMHELGHWYLGHLVDFNETILARGGLTRSEYQVLENEANAFARNILAPIFLINAMDIPWTSIPKLFGISVKAARVRKDFAETDMCGLGEIGLDLLHGLFHPILYGNICNTCQAFFLGKAKHCPICGSKSTSSISNLFKSQKLKEVQIMKYTVIELDDNLKAKVCPRCDNEEIVQDGDFCKICGIDLTNKCTDKHPEINCGNKLPGNARFCPYCGSPSSFYVAGILPDWEIEKQLSEAQQLQGPIFEEIPF